MPRPLRDDGMSFLNQLTTPPCRIVKNGDEPGHGDADQGLHGTEVT